MLIRSSGADEIAQHLALLQKWITASTCFSRSPPSKSVALYEWFSARCRWRKDATRPYWCRRRMSEQLYRWRVGANVIYCLGAMTRRTGWGAFGDACSGKIASGGVVVGHRCVKAIQHGEYHGPTTSLLPSVVCLFDCFDGRFMLIFGYWCGSTATTRLAGQTQRWRTVNWGCHDLFQRSVWRGAMVEELL